MKKVTIALAEDEVWGEIKKSAAYMAFKRGYANAEAMQLVEMLDESKEAVTRAYADAINKVLQVVAEYTDAGNATPISDLIEDDEISIQLVVPDNFQYSTLPSIKQSIIGVIVNESLAVWYSITLPDMSSSFYELEAAEVKSLSNDVTKRMRPTRNDITITQTDGIKIEDL